MPRPLILLAVCDPLVKSGDAIALPVKTPEGWTELIATPGLMRQIGDALRSACGGSQATEDVLP